MYTGPWGVLLKVGNQKSGRCLTQSKLFRCPRREVNRVGGLAKRGDNITVNSRGVEGSENGEHFVKLSKGRSLGRKKGLKKYSVKDWKTGQRCHRENEAETCWKDRRPHSSRVNKKKVSGEQRAKLVKWLTTRDEKFEQDYSREQFRDHPRT